ncbi:MAG: DEAD/DEAH box helicase [Candidatus Sungbacteria bacterium]|uniref:DEAD/DEAH box helicase n=1 Tax=Candidatus Sungiibacteriota bacterium TaxID=2750080 RepID=A0A932QYF3_9BACT|nr:DEAD/DEAH box helicase [Candidatus Sungbacteria bacterium]
MDPHTAQNSVHTFHGLGIAPGILEILARLRYVHPTPIQHRAIPPALEGKDVIGIAQTGTGKTLAFGIPMIQSLARAKGQGLVLVPTRELALQVDHELHKVGRVLGLKTAVLIGGAAMRPQVEALGAKVHIVIATPGRLIDHLEQKNLNLGEVRILVMDEADRMLDMGFQPQIKKILQVVPRERQTLFFSATLPPEIVSMASAQMRLPIRVEIAPPGTVAERVTQEIFIVKKEEKIRLLEKILEQYKGSTLVFVRTKHAAKRITRAFRERGHDAAEIHGNRSLAQRRAALEGFKSGKYRLLIATDIAARGIDVRGIELVVNYDLPMEPEGYVHRIGRTARAGGEGHAISFAMPDEERGVRAIERLIKKNLRISPLPELPPGNMLPDVMQPRAHRPAYPRRRHGPGPFHAGRSSYPYRNRR